MSMVFFFLNYFRNKLYEVSFKWTIIEKKKTVKDFQIYRLLLVGKFVIPSFLPDKKKNLYISSNIRSKNQNPENLSHSLFWFNEFFPSWHTYFTIVTISINFCTIRNPTKNIIKIHVFTFYRKFDVCAQVPANLSLARVRVCSLTEVGKFFFHEPFSYTVNCDL